jgi:hypothetical protein
MKKLIIVLSLLFCAFVNQAQPISYDTNVYYSPEYVGYATCFDTNCQFGISGFGFYYEQKFDNCYVPQYDVNGNVIPPNEQSGSLLGKNTYNIEAVAQPYYLDSSVFICGLKARVHGDLPYYASSGTYKFHLIDMKTNTELVSTDITSSDTMQITPTQATCPFKNYFFDTIINIQNFYLTADICNDPTTYGIPIRFNYASSIYDTTPCLDTMLGCQATHSPLFKKNGVWVRFADDSTYSLFQKIFIEFLPIVLTPQSSILEINSGNTCNIYPNPTEHILNIENSSIIDNIIIYDIIGAKVKEVNNINSKIIKIDINNLKSGSYIVKLYSNNKLQTKKIVVK